MSAQAVVAAVLMLAALAVAPAASAHPDDDGTRTAVCTGLHLGTSPSEIEHGPQRRGINEWQAQRETVWPIIDGDCDN